MDDQRRRSQAAEAAARAGGAVALESFRETIDVETKADRTDLVTEADRAAQGATVSSVREAFPGDPFVCEEDVPDDAVDSREAVPESGPLWVIDPIDGTSNFVRGLRFWGTAVAAVVDGEPVGAATHLPAAGDCYAAGTAGARRNGTPVSVSDRSDPETFAVAATGRWPFDDRTPLEVAAARFGDVRRLGSMQGTLALVAAGALDAAFAPDVQHPWDTVAGAHLVREAGGTVTDLDGQRWRHDSTGPVASNGRDHDAVVRAAREGLGLDGS